MRRNHHGIIKKAQSIENHRYYSRDPVGSRNRIVLAGRGKEQPHCFIAAERAAPTAKESFDRLTAFLKEEVN